MKGFARPLEDDRLIESFLVNCLDINQIDPNEGNQQLDIAAIEDLTVKIRDAEAAVVATNARDTLNNKACRRGRYRDDQIRVSLRNQILKELISLERIPNDEDIRLEVGGAKPVGSPPKQERLAYFITGLPASGKSTLVNKTADRLGAYILDSDFAKRKFPEFDKTAAGANLVHRESSLVIFGGARDTPSLSNYCITSGFNIVMPKIGNDYEELIKSRDTLASKGYKVHLTTVVIPREVATYRALKRFEKTGRYVPLSMVFDGYANDPNLVFYRAASEVFAGRDTCWASIAAISTLNLNREVILQHGDGNPVSFLGE